MKAAVLEKVNEPLAIEEIEIRKPQHGEVLVRTVASGVCHSDLHFMEGLWPTPVPVVLGHESAGVVEEVGDGVTYVKKGDHVVLSFAPFCGICRDCVEGRPQLCTNPAARFPAGRDAPPRLTKDAVAVNQFANMGAFAEYMLVPENGIVKAVDGMPLDKAALVGCSVMTGIGAVLNTAQVEPGSTVAVIGTGGVGLNVIQGAVLANASQIIAVDVLDNKLAYAREMGATDTVNASGIDAVQAVQELARGGVDYAFEAIGNPKAGSQAFDMVRRGGTAVIVGMMPFGSKLELDGAAFLGEKTVKGSFYGSTRFRVDMPRLIDFYLRGKIKLDELVSRHYTLDQINDGFDAMRKGEVARSVLDIGAL
jgi:S-(hydroxymethyl)glutathione dehydrogenase/alcohol dehydrogenase